MWKTILAFLAFALVLPLAGEDTRFWRQNTYEEFTNGRPLGVALRSDGEILLAPEFRELGDPDLEFIWDVVEDAAGNLYLGGGTPAKIIKLAPDGTMTTLFESKELEVHALVLDSRTGTLFAATSPDGSVYRISPEGEASVLFEPGTKYLWALARDSAGTLYLATGDKGEIYYISPDGKGEVFFRSEETHVRALALGPEGNLYAGTEPGGMILRVSPTGEAFVLYEVDRKEVTALEFDARGNLYAAAVGRKVSAPAFPHAPTPAVPSQTTPATQTAAPTVATSGVQTPIPTTPTVPVMLFPFRTTGGSGIYRIAPDGTPETLWMSSTELVYSLSFDNQGRLLAGTGNEGKLLAVDSSTLFTHMATVSGRQITALLQGRAGTVLVATANPGKLYRLGPTLAAEGTFESDVFDAELFAQWGRIRWQSRSPGNGLVRLQSRSGNTSDPEKHWSPWSEPYTDSNGTLITSPAARFIQWKVVLQATDGRTPSFSSVSIAYLRRNLAPTVEEIIVQAPGIRIREIPHGQQPFELVQLDLPAPPKRLSGAATRPRGTSNSNQAARRVEPPPQGIVDPDARSIVWSVDDPNDDDLLFSVYYRGENESRWKLMQDELTEEYYTWDATALADGAYYVKVVASDAPSNPADLAKRGELVSDRFEVDNTPPRIENLSAAAHSRAAEVSFVARDDFSPLLVAEYSLNAGEWKPLFPVGRPGEPMVRTTDAREHSYRFTLENLEPGEHTVVVRVYDSFDNPVLAKTTFTVQ